jgi:hypothetical protein
VDIMLADKQWSKLSDHQIAAACLATQPFVSKRRARLTPAAEDIADAESDNGYHDSEPEQTDLEEWLDPRCLSNSVLRRLSRLRIYRPRQWSSRSIGMLRICDVRRWIGHQRLLD